MATVNRVVTYLSAIHAPTAVAGSSYITATIANVTAEELRLPCYFVQANNVSAGPELRVYRSTDGGASFDTVAAPVFSITRAASTKDQKTVILDGGVYAFSMCTGGPNTCTVGINTVEVLTAYRSE